MEIVALRPFHASVMLYKPFLVFTMYIVLLHVVMNFVTLGNMEKAMRFLFMCLKKTTHALQLINADL